MYIPHFMSYNHCPYLKTSFHQKNDIKTWNGLMLVPKKMSVSTFGSFIKTMYRSMGLTAGQNSLCLCPHSPLSLPRPLILCQTHPLIFAQRQIHSWERDFERDRQQGRAGLPGRMCFPATWGQGWASLSGCDGCNGKPAAGICKQALASWRLQRRRRLWWQCELAGCSDCNGCGDSAS